MKLKETLYYAKKLVLGTALGRFRTYSRPMNFSSNLELVMKCKMFSAGNPLLSEVLYSLNEIGLNTFACCKGHSEKGGYVAFTLNEENKELVSKMCGYLLDNTGASILIGPHHYNTEGVVVSIYFSVKERKKILNAILNHSLYDENQTNRILDEIIKLSELQNQIHSDMAYGIYLEKEDNAYSVETDPIFLMRSLERNISVPGLESVCVCLADLNDEIGYKSVAPIHLLRMLERTNQKIVEIIQKDDNELHDYYAMFTEEELIKIMEMNMIVPGKLASIMNKIGKDRMTFDEEEYYCMFVDSEDLYFLSLRLEESLAYKRQSITLQEEKRVL